MTDEQQARLSDIQAGPWREKSMPARNLLPTLTPAQLQRYLRSHFDDEITDAGEVEFRESFDQILEELQLLELAVACGFLPLDVVRPAAEAEFRTALSTDAARAYVRTYDFVPVRFLAARLGFELGIGDVQPPAINERASVRYAMFLSMHYEFIASAAIRRFLMLIDDFKFRGRFNGDFFKWQLEGTSRLSLGAQEQQIFDEACVGLTLFVEDLGDFFLPVPASERVYFGLAYSYWLSHFFGLRRMPLGYQQRGVNFENVKFSRSLMAPDLDSTAADSEASRFRERVRTLKTVWDDTRKMIEHLIAAVHEAEQSDTGLPDISQPAVDRGGDSRMAKPGAFNQGLTPTIACFNKATTPLGFKLGDLVAAMQIYIDEHVAPVWGTPAKLVETTDFVKGAWAMVFLDSADQPGALAYHDLTPDGLPEARVFVKTTLDNHDLVSVSASHELVEMLVDPATNLMTTGPDPKAIYAYESADPVEALFFDVQGMGMSDFIYPSYFETFHKSGSVQFDHMDKVKKPFQILSGGYQIVFKSGKWSQVFGSVKKEKAFKKEDRRGHRSEMRKAKNLLPADTKNIKRLQGAG
jgi:hypothetical protein